MIICDRCRAKGNIEEAVYGTEYFVSLCSRTTYSDHKISPVSSGCPFHLCKNCVDDINNLVISSVYHVIMQGNEIQLGIKKEKEDEK